MQREFSKEQPQDRQFEIGGELFQWQYPHWEKMAELWDEAEVTEQVDENGNANGQFSFKTDTEFAIKRIPVFLDPANDSHKRFRTLLSRKADPVPRHQIVQLYRWLFQQAAGLPTNPPSGSEPGGGDSDTSSQEGSS